jgi:Domain of unknown function (DUF1961)
MAANPTQALHDNRLTPRRTVVAARLAWTVAVAMGVVFVGCLASALPQKSIRTVRFKEPVGEQGTIAFRIHTHATYSNGLGTQAMAVDLLDIPGVATCRFEQSPTACQLQWVWHKGIDARNLDVEFPALPGPEDYFLQFTWNAHAGLFTGYVNGVPLRVPDTQLPPWNATHGTEARMATGAIEVGFVSADGHHLDSGEAFARVPESLRGKRSELFGVLKSPPASLEVATRLGPLLYESTFKDAASIAGWVMEGPGLTAFQDGWMVVSSSKPNGPEGHAVVWCPMDFPERFVAEWDVQILSKTGLCIVFFAARGLEGEDVFDPSLPQRTGVFSHYTSGSINCYHISYFANTPQAPGRITSNIRKNSGFYLVSNGPPGVPPGSQQVHRVRLVKDAAHTQLQVDGNVVIDSTDEGHRYGPTLRGGKIGFRQMQWTVAGYRNFRVHGLNGHATATARFE